MKWEDIINEISDDRRWADRNDDLKWSDVVRGFPAQKSIVKPPENNNEPGDPVGIRVVQSILKSATQDSLSHFHTAGMGITSLSDRQVPSASNAMDSEYKHTSMMFECVDDVFKLRKHIVGARFGSFVTKIASNITILPERENVWYECSEKPMSQQNFIRFYIDYNKLRNHGLTLSNIAIASFNDDTRISPDFMGMIDIEVVKNNFALTLAETNSIVCGTLDIQSCDKINDKTAITKGTNILAVLRAPGVDKKTITSNNVNEVEKYFGIEAAAHVLSQLTTSCIISDFMARTGTVLSFDKTSVEVRNKGLLTSMGFERPKDDIKKQFTNSPKLQEQNSVYGCIITGTTDTVNQFSLK